jgi:hypothetical protein
MDRALAPWAWISQSTAGAQPAAPQVATFMNSLMRAVIVVTTVRRVQTGLRATAVRTVTHW